MHFCYTLALDLIYTEGSWVMEWVNKEDVEKLCYRIGARMSAVGKERNM